MEYPWVFAQCRNFLEGTLTVLLLIIAFCWNARPLRDAQTGNNNDSRAGKSVVYWHRAISCNLETCETITFASASLILLSVSLPSSMSADNTLLYTGDAAKRESDDLGFHSCGGGFSVSSKPGVGALITISLWKEEGPLAGIKLFDAKLVCPVDIPLRRPPAWFAYSADGWMRSHPNELVDAEFHDVRGQPFAPISQQGARSVACIK